MQYVVLESTVYFWFGSNDTSGSGDDGASAVFDVREGGASSSGAPTLSGSATLLSHANYPAGCYEVAVAATAANGFAADKTYGVFCTLAVDSQNPTGFIGSFSTTPAVVSVTQWNGSNVATPDTAGYPKVTIKSGAGTGELDISSGVLANVGQVDGNVGGSILGNLDGDVGGDITGKVIGDGGSALIGIGVKASLDADGLASDAVTEIQNGLATPTNITAGTITTVTNLTNLPAITANWLTAAGIADDAGTELGTAVWATTTRQLTSAQTFSLTGDITGNLSGSVGSVTGAVGSVTGNVGGNVAGSVASVTDKTGFALTSAYDFAKGTSAMTESYATNGSAPTPVQALYGIHQQLMDFVISGTSYTVRKLDGSTTAFVVTLNDATTPTGATRT